MDLDFAQILGWIATILFSFMLVPQMIKTLKTKETQGVSISLFIIYFIANIIALVYAFLIFEPPLIFKYELALLTTAFYIALYAGLTRKKNKRGKN